jgi:glutamate racemase
MLFGSAAAIARQTVNVLAARAGKGLQEGPAADGRVAFFTSGDPLAVRPVLETMWGEPVAEAQPLGR